MRLAAEMPAIVSSLDRQFIHHFWVKFKCGLQAGRRIERPRRETRVGRHRSVAIKRGGRSQLRLATGRPDLAMVPTVLVCPCWQTVGARAYLDDVSSRAYRHVPRNVGRI
jgi:hypothetical protein